MKSFPELANLRIKTNILTFAAIFLFSVNPLAVASAWSQEAIPVILENQDGNWSLKRDGKPYYIKGAGGEGSLKLLAACGGNSNRLWGVDEGTLARLDEAHRNGIGVALGIWLEHERHGFDYSDEAAVARQTENVLAAVRKYKNHPAVLVWGIGNEMEGNGDNPKIWKHIEELCKLVKREDPNHPTMCVIAELGSSKVPDMHRLCPSLDIIGINSYGGSTSLPKRYKAAGGKKPYIVTEFGPIGTWEVSKNNIGAIEEPISSDKSQMYKKALMAFREDKQMCLGSFAFLWGNKMEATPTWFGLLLPDEKKLAPVDILVQHWTGSKPANLCPVISKFELEGSNTVAAGESIKIKLEAADPEKKILNIKWMLLRDSNQYVTGGDKQAAPPEFPDMIKRSGPYGATIKAPSLGGLYRVYAYVDDGVGAAVANIPILVAGKELESPGKKVKLPFVVFDEPEDNATFVPSGWMGEADGIVVDSQSSNQPKFGKTCVACAYNKPTGWGGVVWQHPESDWGDKPGGVDLSGAKKLSFWVRSEKGGERIKFGFGLIGRGKPFFDTAKKEMEVQMEKEWKKVTFDISGMDLRRIKSGFFWSLASNGAPIKFYVDRIVYE